MAYFYIESTGTRTTGGGQTKKTGAWSSIAAGDKYASPEACNNDSSQPVDGDIVCWRVDDTQNSTSDTEVVFRSGVVIISTAANACEDYQSATTDMLTTDASVFYRLSSVDENIKNVIIHGVKYQVGEASYYDGNCKLWLSDVQYSSTGGDRAIYLRFASRFICVDSDISGPTTGTTDSIYCLAGSCVVLKGGSVSASTTGAETIIGCSSDGASAFLVGVDCSSRTGTPNVIRVASTADMIASVIYDKCKLPSSWVTSGVDKTHAAHVIVENCDTRYQYEQLGYSGDISFVTDVYYTTHATMDDGSTKGSLYFDANANCSPYAPLKYGDYSSGRWLMKDNQSAATLNTLRVFFVTHSADSLDKGDVQIECMYADTADTSKVLVAKHINPIINDSPGALSTETTTAKWTDSGSNSLATTSYYFDLDLTSEGNGLVYWTLALTKADVEMWLSWQCEFV